MPNCGLFFDFIRFNDCYLSCYCTNHSKNQPFILTAIMASSHQFRLNFGSFDDKALKKTQNSIITQSITLRLWFTVVFLFHNFKRQL
jgi:hypothetical protein